MPRAHCLAGSVAGRPGGRRVAGRAGNHLPNVGLPHNLAMQPHILMLLGSIPCASARPRAGAHSPKYPPTCTVLSMCSRSWCVTPSRCIRDHWGGLAHARRSQNSQQWPTATERSGCVGMFHSTAAKSGRCFIPKAAKRSAELGLHTVHASLNIAEINWYQLFPNLLRTCSSSCVTNEKPSRCHVALVRASSAEQVHERQQKLLAAKPPSSSSPPHRQP